MKLATSQFLKENGYVVGKQQATTDGPPVLSHITMTKYTGGRACVPPAATMRTNDGIVYPVIRRVMSLATLSTSSGMCSMAKVK